MLRVVELIRQGRAAGKFMAKVEVYGKTLNVKSFVFEDEAYEYLYVHEDNYFIKLIEKGGRSVRFNESLWSLQAKQQVNSLACKYIFMKQNITTEEGKAIQRYAQDNNLTPQLSSFPVIRFKRKDTGEIIEVNLNTLVKVYKTQVDEEKKASASEKRRKENEDKWKPTFGKYTS